MKKRTLISLLGPIVLLPFGVGGCDPEPHPVIIPADSGLDKNSPADSNPADVSPADVLLDESSSKDSTATDSNSEDSNPVDGSPEDSLLDESSPEDVTIADSNSEDGSSTDSNPVDVNPADSNPVDSAPAIICPSCDELMTWDTTKFDNSSYGQIKTSNAWKDVYAKQMLIACPGWDYFQGHKGGLGDTLQIASCNDGVVLVWAYEYFTSIKLTQGWTGTTDTGLAIGTTYADFVQVYPGYNIASSMTLTSWGYASLDYTNGFATFENSVLTQLNVY